MMRKVTSLIARYYDENGDEVISMGNEGYIKRQLLKCKQLVERVYITQTEEERERTRQMSQEQLLGALNQFINDNQIHVEKPN